MALNQFATSFKLVGAGTLNLGGLNVMKIKILILSSLILLAFFAIAGYAVNWDNPSSQSVDQMLSGSETGVISPIGEYANPAAARSAESGKKGKDILSVPMGGKLDTTASNPQDTRTQDQSQTNTVQNVAANTTAAPAPVQVVAPTEPTSVSGGWSLELTDSASHTAILTLFQSKDAVYGSGNMNLDDNTTLIAAASGSLIDNELNLDLVTLGKVNLYRLDLTVSGESATGNYTAYSPLASPSTGSARGTRTVAS